jgi:hypothetical protein
VEAAHLFNTIIAYTGHYRVEGDELHFDVDVSWNESWTGSHQIRTFELSGDTLVVKADIVNPMTGKGAWHRLTFERVKE